MATKAEMDAKLYEIQVAVGKLEERGPAFELAIEQTGDGYELTERSEGIETRERGELITELGETKGEALTALSFMAKGLWLANQTVGAS